jgi:hypothetical protein
VVRLLLRARYVVVAVSLAVAVAVTYPRSDGGDWWVFEWAARILAGRAGPRFDHLSSGPMHLYTDLPKLQVGPPALLAATPAAWMNPRLEQFLAVSLMAAALVPILWLLERTALQLGQPTDRTGWLVLSGGLLTVPAWTILAVEYRHLDDILAIGLLVVSVHELVHGRRWTMALALGVGAAAKPWAVAFFPLLGALPRSHVAKALLVAIGAAAAWWLPFVLADPGTIGDLGNAGNGLASDSILGLFMHSEPPGWARELQLLAMIAVGVLMVGQGRWIALPVLVVAVRIASDWQAWAYYGAGLMVAALLWDALSGRRRVPAVTALATLAALLPPWVAGRSTTGVVPVSAAVLRLVLLATLCGFVVRADRGARRKTKTGGSARQLASAGPAPDTA